MSTAEMIWVVAAMALGATVQASTGIGLALIASPIVLAIDPQYAPGPLLVMGLVVNLRNMLAEREHFDRQAFTRALAGLPIGLAVGVGLLLIIPERAMAIVIGVLVSGITVAMLLGIRPTRTKTTEVSAGMATGFTSAVAGMPGPPLVIGFHDMEPGPFRALVGNFVTVVVALAVLALAFTGQFGGDEVRLSIRALPGVILGLIAARWARPFFDRPGARNIVLILAFLGGISLVVRSL